jgi:hypothetical protein
MPLNVRKLAFLFLLLFLVLSYSRAYALPYRPENKIRILSNYLSSGDKSSEYAHVWNMEPGSSPEGKYLLEFYPDSGSLSKPICRLKIARDGLIKEIDFEAMEGGRGKTVKTGLLIITDFPVPCDMVPVSQSDAQEVYKDRTEAGGRVFVRKYNVSYRRVDLQEARENGWLRPDLSESSSLNMVTVSDNKGHEVVKQLWPVDGTWWIYEETSLRKSWRVPLSYEINPEDL